MRGCRTSRSCRRTRKNRSRTVALFAFLVAAGLAACGSDAVLVSPASFELPTDIAFTCYDRAARVFVPLGRCDGFDRDANSNLVLTALLTQSARGEIAAVDLRNPREAGNEDVGVLDTDLRVPGFTFVRVGQVPMALVVPADNPTITYIASFASNVVQWFGTDTFHPDAAPQGVPNGMVPLPSGPTDLIESPDGQFLYAALPASGQLAEMPILEDGSLGEPRLLPLSTAVPEPVSPPAVRDDAGDPIPEYERVCNGSTRAPDPATPRAAAGTLNADPRPVRLRVDGETLLVADEALPVVHRFFLLPTGAAPINSINVGVPTLDIAVTPQVPRIDIAAAAADDPARFLYAIDALDRSVMVVDYEPSSSTFGAVLPVSTGEHDPDRIPFFGRARSLAVMTPGFRDGAGALCDVRDATTAADAIPARMRGVVLAIGVDDGSVRFIDVHDLDAPCRGGEGCANPANAGDQIVYIRRHRPRVGGPQNGDFVQQEFEVVGQPSLSFQGAPGTLSNDGAPTASDGPGLVSTTCGAGQRAVFPDGATERGILCAVADPWATSSQQWDAIWEGPIPNTGSARGRLEFSEETLILRDAGAAFCGRGALGSSNVEELGEVAREGDYLGDRVEIVGDLPLSTRENDACAQFLEPEDGSTRTRIELNVVDARTDALVLEDDATIRECFPELIEYRLRTRNAYTVVGSNSGFYHRVIADADGRCAVDLETNPNQIGRAVLGPPRNDDGTLDTTEERPSPVCAYRNPEVSFVIESTGCEIPSGTSSQLSFSIGGVPTQLAIGGGILPDRIEFSPADEQLYVVDALRSGLRIIDSDPLDVAVTFQ